MGGHPIVFGTEFEGNSQPVSFRRLTERHTIGACSYILISGNRLLVIRCYIALICDIMLNNAQIPCRTLLVATRTGGRDPGRRPARPKPNSRDTSRKVAAPDFAEGRMAKGKRSEQAVRARKWPQTRKGLDSAEPKGEIADRALAAHKPHIDKTFGYVPVHDTSVGFRPPSLASTSIEL